MIGFNILPSFVITLVYPNSSVAIKNGRREGTILFAHNSKPSFAATKLFFEKIIRQIVKKQKIAGKIFLLIDKNMNLVFDLLYSTFTFSPINSPNTTYER